MTGMTIIREFNFTYTPMDTYEERWQKAERDIQVLSMWENKKLSGRDARYALYRNNGWADVPTLSEFKEIANNLGYFRDEVPEERKYGVYGEIE